MKAVPIAEEVDKQTIVVNSVTNIFKKQFHASSSMSS